MSELLQEVRSFITACERIHGTLGQGNTLTSDERSLIITSAFELIHALLASGGGLTLQERRTIEALAIELLSKLRER
jgi:hypothetical protein